MSRTSRSDRDPNAPVIAYTVRPFSGPNYKRNAERCAGSSEPCCICGKAITDPAGARMAVVVDAGRAWGDEESDRADPGYMGAYPVGPDCHRKYAVGVMNERRRRQ